jgi:hypothetical protein
LERRLRERKNRGTREKIIEEETEKRAPPPTFLVVIPRIALSHCRQQKKRMVVLLSTVAQGDSWDGDEEGRCTTIIRTERNKRGGRTNKNRQGEGKIEICASAQGRRKMVAITAYRHTTLP